MNQDFSSIHAYLSRLPVVSGHEHHLEGEKQKTLTLDGILRYSYVNWCSVPLNNTREERARWLSSIRANTYFIWLEKSLCRLYGFEAITPENWELISEAIQNRHQDSQHHWDILQKHAGYERFIQDSYWNPGDALSKPELVSSAYRMDSWLASFHPEVCDHDGCNPRAFACAPIDDLDSYEAALRADIEKKKPVVAAFKCAAAYARPLSFKKTSRSQAERIFGKSHGLTGEEERIAFSDYMFQLFLSLAREMDMPVQLHTGLARLPGSNPMLLEPVIARNPDVKFVLFHGGFPWYGEIAALAHNHKNVYIDMSWLPLISTSAAINALHTFLDIVPDAGHITWGGDCWTSEESLGAVMAFQYVVSSVLSQKYTQAFYSRQYTERIAERLMFANAKALYRF